MDSILQRSNYYKQRWRRIRLVTRAKKPPAKVFDPPLEKYIGHSSKKLGPSLKTLLPPWCPKLVTGQRSILDNNVWNAYFATVGGMRNEIFCSRCLPSMQSLLQGKGDKLPDSKSPLKTKLYTKYPALIWTSTLPGKHQSMAAQTRKWSCSDTSPGARLLHDAAASPF